MTYYTARVHNRLGHVLTPLEKRRRPNGIPETSELENDYNRARSENARTDFRTGSSGRRSSTSRESQENTVRECV